MGPTSKLPDRVVLALQSAVKRHKSSGAAFARSVARAVGGRVKGRAGGGPGIVVTTAGKSGLRVTCPSLAYLTIDPGSIRRNVRSVNVYLTKPRPDGVPHTGQVGTASYPDGDGRWSVSFVSERFARTPQEPIAAHAELLDAAGSHLGVQAIAIDV